MNLDIDIMITREVKEINKNNWFKTNENDDTEAVMMTDATPDAELKTIIEKEIENMKLKIRVIERPGPKNQLTLMSTNKMCAQSAKNRAWSVKPKEVETVVRSLRFMKSCVTVANTGMMARLEETVLREDVSMWKNPFQMIQQKEKSR